MTLEPIPETSRLARIWHVLGLTFWFCLIAGVVQTVVGWLGVPPHYAVFAGVYVGFWFTQREGVGVLAKERGDQ